MLGTSHDLWRLLAPTQQSVPILSRAGCRTTHCFRCNPPIERAELAGDSAALGGCGWGAACCCGAGAVAAVSERRSAAANPYCWMAVGSKGTCLTHRSWSVGGGNTRVVRTLGSATVKRLRARCTWYYQLALQEASVQGQYMNYLQVGAWGQLLRDRRQAEHRHCDRILGEVVESGLAALAGASRQHNQVV